MQEKPLKNPSDVIKGREQSIGPIFAIFIILAVLVGGALYFFDQETDKGGAQTATTTVIIYRHAQPTTATTSANSNAELDAIKASLEIQTANVNNLNF